MMHFVQKLGRSRTHMASSVLRLRIAGAVTGKREKSDERSAVVNS
jgi:hypothetical protein